MTVTKLRSIPQSARAAGLSDAAARAMIREKQLPTGRVGRRERVDVRWVEKWLATANPDAPLATSATASQDGRSVK